MTSLWITRISRRPVPAGLVERLRAAGCVFAEDEAAILIDAASDDAELEALTARRAAGEPLEHIVGWVAFGPLRLAVAPGVFVPRQRSLRLARAAVRVARGQRHPLVLEAYAGAAPLAATVAAAIPDAEVHAAEIDPLALRWARANLPDGAGVHESDGFDGLPTRLRGRITLIVAVPPYVPVPEAELVPRDLRTHEPSRALFGGDDGLDQIRALIDEAGPWLAPGGRVLLELNRRQAPAAAGYARRAGFRAAHRTASDGQTSLLDLSR